MFIPGDLWNIIKSFMFHNIKTQGKHLKNDPYIKLYNLTLRLMPPLIIPRSGPRIIYSSVTANTRFIKFIYLRPMKYNFDTNKYINNFVIKEYQILSDNLSEQDYYEQYYSNAYSI